MSACSERTLAQFQYRAMDGIQGALGGVGLVLGLGRLIPHPATQAAAGVGMVAGAGAWLAGRAEKHFRDRYDALEAQCQQEQGVDPYAPTSPRPGGGGGGSGTGAVSGGYQPRLDYEWRPGSSSFDPATETWTVTAGKWTPVWRPIIFDLDNDGFDLRTLADPIVADANFDGVMTARTWVGPTDGLLVYDYNQNGIGETAEWVLTSFVPGATTDLEALRAFDSNNDGVFSSADAQFSKFKIGVDANQDGIFSVGELQSLSSIGLTHMQLNEGYSVEEFDGVELAPGVALDAEGIAYAPSGALLRYASVGFMEFANQQTLYQNSNATIVSNEGVKSLFWTGTAALNVSTATFSYGGHTGFANIFGGAGNDVIQGDAKANALYGGAGTDQLIGGAGHDVLFADAADLANGVVSGGADFDTLILQGAISGTVFASNYQVEAILGTAAANTLSGAGSTTATLLFGSDGNDKLLGSGYDDVLSGGAGNDILRGHLGNDTYLFEVGDMMETVDDYGGLNDMVILDRSGYDVVQFSASGDNQVLTFNDGGQLVLVNGRLSGMGVEKVEFTDVIWSREDINIIIDIPPYV